MADTPLSERFTKVANEFVVPFMGGLIASLVARNVTNGFWRELAVIIGVFVIYSVIVGLLKRAWARGWSVPFIGGLIAYFVARNVTNGFWREVAVYGGVFVIYSVIVGLLKRAW